jgi:hypothetical protein
MKVDRDNLERNLPRKGFERKKSGHHIYFHHKFNGRATGAYTYLSHSIKVRDIAKALLTSIRKQLMLDSNAQVVDLVNCPMDGDEYNKILRQKGVLP